MGSHGKNTFFTIALNVWLSKLLCYDAWTGVILDECKALNKFFFNENSFNQISFINANQPVPLLGSFFVTLFTHLEEIEQQKLPERQLSG